MGFVDDMLLDDMAAFQDAFGETVVYLKHDGTTRTIKAIVDRPEPSVDGVGALNKSIRATVNNSSTTGIAATEIRFGACKLRIAEVRGGATVDMLIHKATDGDSWHDAGAVRLELH
jgi:hypothetical protein